MRKLVFYNLLLIIAFMLASCNQSYYVSKVSLENYPVDTTLANMDPAIVSLYAPYKQSLDADMSKVIGVSEFFMEKKKPESRLTNFLGDLLLEEGNKFLKTEGKSFAADVSYFNYGGIRSFIPEGEITVRNIFELMPFENEMVFLKLKGTDLKLFLDKIAENGGESLGGVRFAINNGKADKILFGGKSLNTEVEYWLVTNDYIAGGGDGMEMLGNALEQISSGKSLRNIIIRHLEDMQKNNQVISAETDGRMYYE